MSIADMFFEEGDDQIGTTSNTFAASYKGNQISISSISAKPKNCAGELDLPPMPRLKSNFVGLEN
jgi:hypothetical protein